MENRPYALAVGLFTILLGLALVGGAAWLSRSKSRDTVHYEIVTTGSIVGLTQDAIVRFRGVDVGRVQSIHFDPNTSGQIDILLRVSPDAPITQSTYAQLGYQGITGIAYVQLDDDGRNPKRLDASGDTIRQIPMHASDFDTVKDAGQELLKRMNRIAGRLDGLLDQENVQHIQDLLVSLKQTSDEYRALAQTTQPVIAALEPAAKSLGPLIKELQPTVKALPDLVDASTRTLNQADTTLTTINQTTTQLGQQLGGLGNTVDGIQSLVTSLRRQTLPDLHRLIQNSNRSLVLVNHGIEEMTQSPQSLLVGPPTQMPGPGEPGFRRDEQ